MSAIIIPGTLVPVRAIAQTDMRTPVIAGTYERPGISCDTFSDLPGAHDFDGYELQQDSFAHVIEENKIYCMKSSGNWELQEESPFKDVYTKAEVDALDRVIWTDLDILSSTTYDYITNLINEGAKNLVNITAQSGIFNGVTFTVNDDGTVKLSGTATQYYSFRICGVSGSNAYADAIPIPRGEYVLSGIGTGASSSKQRFILGLFANDSASRQSISIYDNYPFSITSDSARFDLSIYTATGAAYSPDIIVSPMICEAWKQAITDKFIPYSPSNADLARMIKNYHS